MSLQVIVRKHNIHNQSASYMEVKLTNMWPPSETKKRGRRDKETPPPRPTSHCAMAPPLHCSAHDLKNSYLACDELKKENSSKESSDVDDALWD
jgi:hypothetical protein